MLSMFYIEEINDKPTYSEIIFIDACNVRIPIASYLYD